MPDRSAHLIPAQPWLTRLMPESVRCHRLWPRAEPWVRKLGEFFVAQGLLQLMMAVTGFFFLRWMPVQEYAAYTLAFAIQSSMIAFTDVGFSSAIIPLVGARVDDRAVIGAYIAGARRLRLLLLPFVLTGGGVVFCVLGHRQQISWPTIAGLAVCAAVMVWFNVVTVLYGQSLLIRQELRVLNVSQNAMGALRFAVYIIAYACGWLGSVFALALNTLLNAGMAGVLRGRARKQFDEPVGGDPAAVAARREILRFVRPQLPVMIFNAVEGQIVVFLVSIVGGGAALAETGALSRLNMLFAITPALYTWIIQPYFARIAPTLAARRFWQIAVAGGAILSLAPIAGFVLPEPFLWLLGPHYAHLRVEVGLLLLANSIGCGVALVSTLSLARRWVFDDAILWIALLTVGFQTIAVAVHDVSRPAGAFAVMIWGNSGSLLAYLILAVRGQRSMAQTQP